MKEMQVMVLPIKKQEQGITTRGTEYVAALLRMPLKDLSKMCLLMLKCN